MTRAEREYVWKMTAQAWRDDPHYVGSSAPRTPIEVVAATQQEAINEAARALGDPGRHWVWRFFGITARDLRIPEEAS
jgi:hypothetical protein